MDQFVGQRIGDYRSSDQSARYEVKAVLGRQTGRRTLLAEDSETGCLVVVKLMLFGPDFTWQDLKLFEREAETLKSLNHPAIPKYLDSFEVETHLGKGFALVQTYIEAKSLQEWVSSGCTFSEDDLRAIASEILHILDYLHHRQPPVIHRDLKPSNILLTSQKSDPTGSLLYLVDFGSVQTVASDGTMTVVGTYGYMPPEQFGGRAQPASDLYAVGATLIYLATGRHPADLIQSDLQIEFEDEVTLSPSFSNWLRRITYADIKKRAPSAESALHQLANGQSVANDLSIEALGSPVPNDLVRARYRAACLIRKNHRDIQVFSSPEAFGVHLSSARLEGSPRFGAYATANKLLRFLQPIRDIIIPAVWVGIAFFNETLLGYLVVILVPLGAIYILWTALQTKPIALRLVMSSTNQVWLNLSKLSKDKDKSRLASSAEQLPQLVDSEVKTISAGDYGFFYQIRFQFAPDQKISSLRILGTLREIDWLCEHIIHWGDIPIKYSGALARRRENGFTPSPLNRIKRTKL